MRSLLLIITGLILISCSNQPNENTEFIRLANNFTDHYLRQYPEWATSLGDHRYDHLLNGYSVDEIAAETHFLQSYLDSLETINPVSLNQVNRIDFRIMQHNIEGRLFSLTTLKAHEWNPLHYNTGDAVYTLLARDFAPLRERLDNLKQRLAGIPKVLEQAKINLKNPPKIHTETAILQNKGNIHLIQQEINQFLNQIPEIKNSFREAQNAAVTALENYGQWLESELLPKSTGNFRLGDEKYRKKLYYTLESDLSKEDILARASSELTRTQDEMYATALPLYKKYYPEHSDVQTEDRKHIIKAVLDRLADAHPDNSNIVDLAKKKLQNCTEFVKAKSLVTMPENPIEIIVMPEFQRGVAVAYCDAPGALEEKGETFFAISPTPKDWSKDRIESFFREYNNYMLDNLTIHEAVPGHYLQLMHANRFRAPSKIRAIFASGTFIEGWATYAEQLMVETGFIGPELKMQQLKMRLRLIINAIIDQKIHTEEMTEQEAMDLMMEEGYQEEGEAAGKWRRACLTSTQLATYFVGNIEVNDLRAQYEKKYGSQINMREMHDRMLSFGSPAAKYVVEMLEL